MKPGLKHKLSLLRKDCNLSANKGQPINISLTLITEDEREKYRVPSYGYLL